MAKSTTAATLLAAILLWLSSELTADSYRCGRKLLRNGDSSADVLRLCGEPTRKDRGREAVRLNGTRQAVPVERWYFKKSSRSLERIVVIHQGRVVSIEIGER